MAMQQNLSNIKRLSLLLVGAFLITGSAYWETPKKSTEAEQCLTASPVRTSWFRNKNQRLPSVHFLITTDPQYDENFMYPDGKLSADADEVSSIIKQKIHSDKFRGLLIAGDLTHNSGSGEFERYKKFVKGISLKVYEGLGNHDFNRLPDVPIDIAAHKSFGFEEMMDEELIGWDDGSLALFDYIRCKKRAVPVHSSFPNIHYSWDWDDVHFVQLNLFPGDKPVPRKTIQNPFKAFDFLKEDLAKYVGNSNRPVVLIHHYGFDNFSRGIGEDGKINKKAEWWTVEQRQAYWDVLSTYNVKCTD